MTPFGTTAKGEEVHKLTLSSGKLTVSLLTLGAIIQDVRLDGIPHSLTIGSDDIADYEGPMHYHGGIIGPVVGRISNARVKIDGMMYELERNENGQTHLHSGGKGTQHQVWSVTDLTPTTATLEIKLPDGMCGLPGNRQISATYRVEDTALTLKIIAKTDSKTPISLANHSYWKLDGTPTWTGHTLQIAADHYLPTTGDNTPTGDITPVENTPFDFRKPRQIIPGAPAIDHNFCLSNERQPLRDILHLISQSGIQMTMTTTEPGVQIYDGREDYKGLAIEAQMWPDAANHSAFPSIMLEPMAKYQQTTRWTFT